MVVINSRLESLSPTRAILNREGELAKYNRVRALTQATKLLKPWALECLVMRGGRLYPPPMCFTVLLLGRN